MRATIQGEGIVPDEDFDAGALWLHSDEELYVERYPHIVDGEDLFAGHASVEFHNSWL